MNYYLFAGDNYYPLGGHNDLKANVKLLDEAIAAFKKWVDKDDPTIGMCWSQICFGSDLTLLATANFDREYSVKAYKNMIELLSNRHNLWEGSVDYLEPLTELNRLTRLAFLGE